MTQIHCPPGISDCFYGEVYHLDDTYVPYRWQLLSMFMIVRLFIPIRYLRSHNRFSSPTARVVLKLYGQQGGTMLSVKDFLHSAPILSFSCAYAGGILIFA